MASIANWVPIPTSSEITGKVAQISAVERVGVRSPMSSDTLTIPRNLNAVVGGGATLSDNTSDEGTITLYSYLFNGKDTLREDEVEDAGQSGVLEAKSMAWRSKLSVAFDNAALGVSGAYSGTESDKRPYTSVLRALREENDSQSGYTAGDNHLAGTVTYSNLSTVMGYVEDGEYFEEDMGVWICHTSVKSKLRNLVDDQHRPIFIDSNAEVKQATIFGRPAVFTRGARVSTNFDMTVTGYPLAIYVNRNYLVFGPRVEPQARFIDASTNTTSLHHTLQYRARLGAALLVPQAAGVLEINA